MVAHQVVEFEENYLRFVERAQRGGSVWTLECEDGRLTVIAHNGEQPIMPFWSDAAYARRALKDAPLDGYSVKEVPLEVFLGRVLGDLQHDDVLVGPNYSRDMAGLELDPREVFEEFRSRMTPVQLEHYRGCLEGASILTVGHPTEKLQGRIACFARIVLSDPDASPCTLVRHEDPVQIDIRARPGSSFVPVWSSVERGERARKFCFAPDDPVMVVGIQLQEFLATAEEQGWLLGVDPTIGLACAEVRPGELRAALSSAEEALEDEGDDD